MSSVVYRIEVRPKSGVPDSRGAAALRDVQSLGLPHIPNRIDSTSVEPGLGLRIVEGVAERWGVSLQGEGKVVWAEV